MRWKRRRVEIHSFRGEIGKGVAWVCIPYKKITLPSAK